MSTIKVRVPISSIKLPPQVRTQFKEAAIHSMAESIRSIGLQTPPLCRKVGTEYVCIDGECRIRAHVLLEEKEIDILLDSGTVSEVEALTRALVCNIQRNDLNPVDRAGGLRSLMSSASLSAEQAGKMLGLSAGTVTRHISILKLPADLLQRVAVGEISADAAYMLSRIEDPAEQKRLAMLVIDGQLSRDGLARKLKATRRSDERRASGSTRCTALLGKCSLTFDGPGLSLDTMIEWTEQLLARARKAKSNGLTLETFVRALRDQASEPKGAKP